MSLLSSLCISPHLYSQLKIVKMILRPFPIFCRTSIHNASKVCTLCITDSWYSAFKSLCSPIECSSLQWCLKKTVPYYSFLIPQGVPTKWVTVGHYCWRFKIFKEIFESTETSLFTWTIARIFKFKQNV